MRHVLALTLLAAPIQCSFVTFMQAPGFGSDPARIAKGDKDFIASQPRRALRFSQAGVCMTTTEAMERAMAVAGEMTAADESDGERSRQSAAFTDLNS